MRNPRNNPTDRILRLLSELDGALVAYEELRELAAFYCPRVKLNELNTPSRVEFELEKQRQGGSYERVRPAILQTRDAMRKRRLREGELSLRDGALAHARGVQEILDKNNVDVMLPLTADNITQRLEALTKREMIDKGKVILPEKIAEGNFTVPGLDFGRKKDEHE